MAKVDNKRKLKKKQVQNYAKKQPKEENQLYYGHNQTTQVQQFGMRISETKVPSSSEQQVSSKSLSKKAAYKYQQKILKLNESDNIQKAEKSNHKMISAKLSNATQKDNSKVTYIPKSKALVERQIKADKKPSNTNKRLILKKRYAKAQSGTQKILKHGSSKQNDNDAIFNAVSRIRGAASPKTQSVFQKDNAVTRFLKNPEADHKVIQKKIVKKRYATEVFKKFQQTFKSILPEEEQQKQDEGLMSTILKNPITPIIVIGLMFLMIGILMVSFLFSFFMNYTWKSDWEEIDKADLYYTEMEANLDYKLKHIKELYPGYDSYEININGEVGHNPFILISYLSTKHDDFQFSEIKGELETIFQSNYILAILPETLERSYVNGEGETVTYTVKRLTVNFDAVPMSSLVRSWLGGASYSTPGGSGGGGASGKTFITDEIKAAAERSERETGIPAAITLGQMILESRGSYGNGVSYLAYYANNYFGVKAGPSWHGEVFYAKTKEYVGGQAITITAPFRKYPSVYESINDHSQVLLNSRYTKYTSKAKNLKEYCEGIQKGGYATAPNYAEELYRIIVNNGFDTGSFETSVAAPQPTEETEDNEQYEQYLRYMELYGNRQFFESPIDYNWYPLVSSIYGWRLDPVTSEVTMHKGIDISVEQGTVVKAISGGTVLEAGFDSERGNYIIIQSPKGYISKYYHLKDKYVSSGDSVKQRMKIGTVGNTGKSTGAHLHLELIDKNGGYRNPLFYVGVESEEYKGATSGGVVFDGDTGDEGQSDSVPETFNGELTEITAFACKFVGKPYVWGGTNPNTGADCSGFVQYVYAHFGINLPRTSRDQVTCGSSVASINDAKPGDLMFYAKDKNGDGKLTDNEVYHVVMYLGNGKIVHASNEKPYPKGGIKISNVYGTIYKIKRIVTEEK